MVLEEREKKPRYKERKTVGADVWAEVVKDNAGKD